MKKRKNIFLISVLIMIIGMVYAVVRADTQATVTATVSIGTVSVTVQPTSFDYGAMPLNSSKESFDVINESGVHNIKATVGTVITDLNIKGANTTCDGTCTPWTLASSNGANQYVHKFGVATNGTTRPSSYTALTTSYDDNLLADNVEANGEVYFGLEITTPTSATTANQSASVSVQATWGG